MRFYNAWPTGVRGWIDRTRSRSPAVAAVVVNGCRGHKGAKRQRRRGRPSHNSHSPLPLGIGHGQASRRGLVLLIESARPGDHVTAHQLADDPRRFLGDQAGVRPLSGRLRGEPHGISRHPTTLAMHCVLYVLTNSVCPCLPFSCSCSVALASIGMFASCPVLHK
jgi:hypothetical protein